jgi:hypothetical protein
VGNWFSGLSASWREKHGETHTSTAERSSGRESVAHLESKLANEIKCSRITVGIAVVLEEGLRSTSVRFISISLAQASTLMARVFEQISLSVSMFPCRIEHDVR